MATGEAWDLGGGFTLTARQIDINGDKVWLSLAKNGRVMDETLIDASESGDRRYMYTENISGVEDVVVFFCWVDAVFRGTESNLIQVEVMTANHSQIVLKNDGDLDLNRNSDVRIMKGMYFKVADNDTMRFYPFVEHTIRSAASVPEEPDEEFISDGDGDGVPDFRDKEPDTPRGYWVNSQGIGRRWGDMNGDGKLTSADALTLLQAAAEKIDMG